MKKISYKIKDELGIHARPAGSLVKTAQNFSSVITIKNEANGKQADCKRIIGVMALGVRKENHISIFFEGEDEEEAALNIERFLLENL